MTLRGDGRSLAARAFAVWFVALASLLCMLALTIQAVAGAVTPGQRTVLGTATTTQIIGYDVAPSTLESTDAKATDDLATDAASAAETPPVPSAGGVSAVRVVFVAAETAPDGIVYLRTDLEGGKPYVGQAKSESRYFARQAEHARANPEADFEFEVLGRADPGPQLDRLEEYYIRQRGGPTSLSNPNGGLANLRHQMSESRYLDAGGDW